MRAYGTGVGYGPTANGERGKSMPTNRRIGMFLLLAASLAMPTSAAGAGELQWLHRTTQTVSDTSQGTVRVLDGVLRGSALAIPKEGLALEEVVSRSLRAGAKLASSDWGADIPTDPSAGNYKGTERWYVVVTRGGTSHFLPASFVQYSPLGSLPLIDQDVVSVVDARLFASPELPANGSNVGPTEVPTGSPIVKVASVIDNGRGMVGQAVFADVAAGKVMTVFGGVGLDGYAAIHREISGVRGTFILRSDDNQFGLRNGDVVHWVQPQSLHAMLAQGRLNQAISDGKVCLDRIAQRRDVRASQFERMSQRVVAPIRATAAFLRLPAVF